MGKILVSGGAGFIGSHVVDRLLEEGNEVICVDNFNTYYNPKRKEANISHHLGDKNFKLYRFDITRNNEIKHIFETSKIDKVVHLAASAGVRPSLKNPKLFAEVNIKGLLTLLELCKKGDVKKFIFGSSSSVYGERKTGPFKEDDKVDKPISPYAATKKAGELLCHNYSYLYGMNCTCLRFFTVYGPRGRPDMAPMKFTRLIDEGKKINIYGDGSALRDFTYVSDIVDGILTALKKDFPYEIINLGNSNPVQLNFLIERIQNELGKKAIIEYGPKQKGDVSKTFADMSKAQTLLNYKPKVSLEQGVKEMVLWYKNNPLIK